ncbi:hypothetical protein B9Z55_015781 [Caenorhabditis nigoni]|uniref:SXP/RAL-2 family protein Ani s 5-like cation-binding domain-containing protein n=1 Tax=Caenorhabditis nigoni TaxID=1611254 RepID=A0A2G5UBN6_9PELO|nr:hypothetical protein B9Z55_015781 [Caenorhabditis nigoni]
MKFFLLLILIPFSISFDLENSDRPDTVTQLGGFNSGDSETTVIPQEPQNDHVETTVTQEDEEDCKKKKTTVIPKPAAPVNSNHGDSPINFDEEEDGYSTPSTVIQKKIKEMQEAARKKMEEAQKRIEENKAKLLENFKNFKN